MVRGGTSSAAPWMLAFQWMLERKTALHFAARNGYVEAFRLLLRCGANIHAVGLSLAAGLSKKTALHCAADSVQLQSLQCLLQYSANVCIVNAERKQLRK